MKDDAYKIGGLIFNIAAAVERNPEIKDILKQIDPRVLADLFEAVQVKLVIEKKDINYMAKMLKEYGSDTVWAGGWLRLSQKRKGLFYAHMNVSVGTPNATTGRSYKKDEDEMPF